MAVIKQDFNVMYLPAAIQRNNPIPLDSTALWYNYDEMLNYATTDPTAYVGQVLSLITNNKAEAYIITNPSGKVEKIGSGIIVDNDSLVIDNDMIGLKDFGKYYYRFDKNNQQYILQEVNEEYPWIPGLEPKVVSENGELVLGWFEPNLTSIEGVNSALDTLQVTVNDLHDTVNDLSNDVNEIENILQGTYTKDEVDNAILQAISNINNLTYKKVNYFSDIENDIENNIPNINKIIYLVPALDGLSHDVYEEYMIFDGVIEKLGSWEVNLENYATKEEVNQKVDKIDGFGLISDSDNIKLKTIEAGAQKNYISDVSDNFEVNKGQLSITSLPSNLNLSNNSTIQNLNTLVSTKVTRVAGKSLVDDELIEKLVILSTDTEKNVINDVSSEFEIDDNRTLSIVSVKGDKIIDLNLNSDFNNLSTKTNSALTDLRILNNSLSDLDARFNAYKTQVANTYVTKQQHQADIDNILAILTWQDLDDPIIL